MDPRAYMFLLVAIWYLFSYLFNASLKDWFRSTEDHACTLFLLLLAVFLSNAAAAGLWALHGAGCLTSPRRAMSGLRAVAVVLWDGLRLDLLLLCASGAVGVAASCIVLQQGSIQLVQVARSMGPLFTALWAYLVLDQRTTGGPLACLGITLAGTALASWQEPTFSALTFCLMLTINMTLTFRNAVTKRVIQAFQPATAAAASAGYNLVDAEADGHRGPSSSKPEAAAMAATEGFEVPAVMSCLLLALTNLAGLFCVMVLWALHAYCSPWDAGAMGRSWSISDAAILPPAAWYLLVKLGTCNLMYNMASQIVLAHVHVVSHGMLELFKRVFVLLAASLLLGDIEWRWHNALGAALATAGTMLYFSATTSHGSAAAAGRKPQSHGNIEAKALLLSSSPVSLAKRGGAAASAAGAAGQGLLPPEKSSDRLGPQPGTGVRPGSWTARRRLQWAYGLMCVVLVLSPLEFMDGAGAAALMPRWFTITTAPAATATAIAESWALWAQRPQSNVGLGSNSSESNATTGGNQSGPLEILSLEVPPPSAAFYGPADGKDPDGSQLKGGILQLRGLLPFHRRLARAKSSNVSCTAKAKPAAKAKDKSRRSLLAEAEWDLPPRLALKPSSVLQGGRTLSGDSPAGFIGLYTGWLGKVNLGDDIVADIFLDLLAAAIIEASDASTCVSLERISPGLAAAGWRGCSMENGSGCDFGVLGGGSLVYVDYIKRLAPVLTAGRPVLLFGSGHQSGQKTKSTSDKYFNMLCQGSLIGGVRGHYTKGFLARYGCGKVRVVRDSALLAGMLYGGGKTVLRAQLKEHSGLRHVVVATLKGSSSLPVFNSTLHTLLKTGNFVVVLQAVDEESARLHRHYSQIFDDTRPAGMPHVLFHDEYKDWAAILDLYRHASVSLNSRLHSGVLSLAAPRPTVYLANNVKYADLMGSLDMPSLLIDPTRSQCVDAGPQLFGEHVAGQMAEAVRQTPTLNGQLQHLQKDTMLQYKSAMADLLANLERQDPERYRATLCCQHIKITRSTPSEHRMLVTIQCLKKRSGSDKAEECKDLKP